MIDCIADEEEDNERKCVKRGRRDNIERFDTKDGEIIWFCKDCQREIKKESEKE